MSNFRAVGYPVFHDDQHGTAIIVSARCSTGGTGGKRLDQIRMVVERRGSSPGLSAPHGGAVGVPKANITLVEVHGVVYAGVDGHESNAGRDGGGHRGSTLRCRARADVSTGFRRRCIKEDMVRAGGAPVDFCQANPDPEIPTRPPEALPGCINGTGRSD
jgi:malate dehydrogenase (oxaloacetate-decarboxylating)(NADP+)